MRKRFRKFEKLEARNLLAASPLISEINFDQLFDDDNRTQYVELRGAPSTTLPTGSYLVIVDSEANSQVAGEVHGIFDLSGIGFGSNGFLVLQPMSSPFISNPAANTLKSDLPAFGGLPGGIYTDSHDLSDRLDFIFAANTFFLIQSDVPPLLSDDIDLNNDGFVDPSGVYANWNVYDSISTMWSLGNSYGYGSIVFTDSNAVNFPTITAPAETPVVRVNGGGYVGRVGNSTGSQAEDWVSGTITQDNDFQNYVVRIAGGTFGQPSIMAMHGRQLNHLGSENFTGASRLQYFIDVNGNGQVDSDESYLAGVEVLADTNGNGTRDSITTIVEPDDYPDDLELNNLIPGVTLGTASGENVLTGFPIEAAQRFGQPVGVRNLSNSGIDFFTDGFRLRADFYRPAQSVSLAILGVSNSIPTHGRLDAFNAANELIATRSSNALAQDIRQTLNISRPTDDIAYVVAYPDLDPPDASTMVRLDTFSFQVPEAVDITDENGLAVLNYLAVDDYTINQVTNTEQAYLTDSIDFQIAGYRNFDALVPLALNVPPIFDSTDFSAPENLSAGSEVGVVVARTHSTQSVTYELVGDEALLTIGSSTGVVRLRQDAAFDFETNNLITFRVKATDSANPPLSNEQDFRLDVTDVNEPPEISPFMFTVPETIENGATIGFVRATDPDSNSNSAIGYRISGNNPGESIAINGQTGELLVQNASYFNFETRNQIAFNVVAYDFGTPSLVASTLVTIVIEDVNEPPTITTESLSVGELATGGGLVGTIEVQDADLDQTYSYRWAEGFETELFVIDSQTGVITVADGADLDFNVSAQYELQVFVEDSGSPSLSDSAAIAVAIIDQNNLPVILEADLSVDENASAATAVGRIEATDRDLQQTLSFQIVGGDGQAIFSIDEETGEVQVSDGKVLDFETGGVLQIVVRVLDSGTPAASAERTFEIRINDINEAPIVTAITELTIAEDAAPETELGIVSFSDPDAGDAPTIRMVESEFSDWFAIDSTTGMIRLTEFAELDFETFTSITLGVEVTDGVNSVVLGELRIDIEDRNEAPLVNGSIETIEVLAGYARSLTLAGDFALDPDGGQSLRWRLTSTAGDLPAWILFDEPTRTFSVAPWNAAVGEYEFMLTITDSGSPPLSVEVPVAVNVDFNSSPWQNRENPLDVNGDNLIRPLDALVVINYLNRASNPNVPIEISFRPNFLDVNGNNVVEPIDALRIINELNRNGSGEGEQGFDPVPFELLRKRDLMLEEKLRRARFVDQAMVVW